MNKNIYKIWTQYKGTTFNKRTLKMNINKIYRLLKHLKTKINKIHKKFNSNRYLKISINKIHRMLINKKKININKIHRLLIK
jgi:hypothetical protein